MAIPTIDELIEVYQNNSSDALKLMQEHNRELAKIIITQQDFNKLFEAFIRLQRAFMETAKNGVMKKQMRDKNVPDVYESLIIHQGINSLYAPFRYLLITASAHIDSLVPTSVDFLTLLTLYPTFGEQLFAVNPDKYTKLIGSGIEFMLVAKESKVLANKIFEMDKLRIAALLNAEQLIALKSIDSSLSGKITELNKPKPSYQYIPKTIPAQSLFAKTGTDKSSNHAVPSEFNYQFTSKTTPAASLFSETETEKSSNHSVSSTSSDASIDDQRATNTAASRSSSTAAPFNYNFYLKCLTALVVTAVIIVLFIMNPLVGGVSLLVVAGVLVAPRFFKAKVDDKSDNLDMSYQSSY